MDDLPSYTEVASGSRALDDSAQTPRSDRKRDKKAVQFDESTITPGSHLDPPRYGRRRAGPRDVSDDDLDLGVALPADLAYTRDWYGDVVCTDARVNGDPALMAAFLRHHGAKPPLCHVRVTGDHWEDTDSGGSMFGDSQRDHESGDGRSGRSPARAGDRRKVTDFSFSIPLTPELLIRRSDLHRRGPVFCTLAPSQKALRGGTFRRKWRPSDDDVLTLDSTDSVAGARRTDAADLESQPIARPPNAPQATSVDPLAPSTGQRAILAYLHSRAPLKRFTLEKRTFGWSAPALRAAIERQLRAPPLCYTHDITVRLECADGRVHIRPPNVWTRIDTSAYFTVFKWLLLPLGILWTLLDWLYLGARWQVLVARFDLYRAPDQIDDGREYAQEADFGRSRPRTDDGGRSSNGPATESSIATDLIDLSLPGAGPSSSRPTAPASQGGRRQAASEVGMPLDRFLVLFSGKITEAAMQGVADGRELSWDFPELD